MVLNIASSTLVWSYKIIWTQKNDNRLEKVLDGLEQKNFKGNLANIFLVNDKKTWQGIRDEL